VKTELALAEELGVGATLHDTDAARALEPDLVPVFRAAVLWADSASLTNPLAVTRAHAVRFTQRGGLVLQGDARSLHRSARRWRLDTAEGAVDADNVVIALGAWAPDVLERLGLRLPLAIKRGYHLHFRRSGNASLARPVIDTDNGYAFSEVDQGVRVTTGAEFADRDAAPTPVQFDRVLPAMRELFPLGEQIEPEPWMGNRPCFADSRPVIGRAPDFPGLWLAYGHGHVGLSLGPVTGRLIAEMMTGQTPYCDPEPYAPTRFY
jgi:D-amino-acid dehydrogenase